MNSSQVGWNASSETGVVAAGGARAVEAGIHILNEGGNAADAAAATILALNVTDHGACSIGGEVPVLIYNAQDGKVKSLSGQGRAPLSEAAIAWYMNNGIPARNIKMAPVPSVVDLCITMLQQYGTNTFEKTVTPTLDLLAADEESWHNDLAKTLTRMIEEERRTDGNREERLQGACDRFYGRLQHGNDIADELEEFYVQQGGFLRRSDLAAHKTLIEQPVSINYKGYAVYKCGPWTQGPYLCQALKILEGFDIIKLGRYSPDYVHLITETIKLAMADRDAYYGDPNFTEVPLTELLAESYAEIRRPLIDMANASHEIRPGDPINMTAIKEPGVIRPGAGGTTTCLVADRWGNVVAATPSANVFHEGGSGRAGVTYGNRLRSLNTTPGHPNCIAPGKRPRITLSPTLVLKDDRPILAVSVEGGDMQDQMALNLVLDFIEFGTKPAEAVLAPWFSTGHGENSFNPDPIREQTFHELGSLSLTNRTKHSIQAALQNKGHSLQDRHKIGSLVAVYLDPESKRLYAAGDPDTQRHAAAMRGG